MPGISKIVATTTGLSTGTGVGFAAAAQPVKEEKIPKRTDPEIEAARKRAQRLAKLRKGRRATILTSGRGVTDPLGSVSRPQARAAKLLGGTL